MSIHRMHWVWRSAFVLLIVVGLVAAVASGAELTGLVERGAWIGDAADGERWAAVVVGALLQPFAWTALLHSRLVLTDTELRCLGFGIVCRERSIALHDVRRWGHAVARNQRRRERMLIFELHDGSAPTVKLEMYERVAEVLDGLTQRLGAPAPAKATMTGVRFED